ncbi:MAG: hypothetical protein HZA91_06155 [Verrucomicrobia bacterium]|nr:hypothetical protein [Verrucomicrobiota bacterium]
MKPDPEAQERYEELLKSDSGIVVPPSPAGGEQHKLHILTALLNKYKAAVRPPVTARHDATGYEARIQRVMRLTEGIRPEPPARRDYLAPLRQFLSIDWARPVVWVPIAVSAMLVAGLTVFLVNNQMGEGRHTLLVMNCIPADSVAQQFVLRGGTTTQVRSAEITTSVLSVVGSKFAPDALATRYADAQEHPAGPATTYPEALLRGTLQRYALIIARAPTADGGQLELRLYDTKKKALVAAKRIEASDPDELREVVRSGAESLLRRALPHGNR